MKIAATVLLLLATSNLLMATAQDPDILYYKGKKQYIHTNPLEDLFNQDPKVRERFDEARFKPRFHFEFSTGNYRGYIAEWTIEKGKLLLTELRPLDKRSILKDVFPDQKRVFAEWFTGLLVVPTGELSFYMHRNYDSIYKKYTIIRVEKGTVLREKKFNGKEYETFRNRQLEAFKKTEEYKKGIKKLRENGEDAKPDDKFLYELSVGYTSKMLLHEI